jgi:hypothetical protein
MLDALYTNLFRPGQRQPSPDVSILVGLLVALILALNAAGALQVGVVGALGFLLVFGYAGLLGLFWLAAAVNLLAQLFGGEGGGRSTLVALTQSLWPLLLSGPAIAANQWSNSLGNTFSFFVLLGTYATLTGAIHQVHRLSWLTSALCLGMTLVLSGLALMGLFLWPFMIFLGT